MVFQRSLRLPEHSFFLFGPRGTGKTTWLKQVLPNALWFDLLRAETYLPLLRRPGDIRRAVQALPPGGWVVVDEVQRLPALLDEIQSLLAEPSNPWKFALSGSSARKLKRANANLLAGRAINRSFFPLTAGELGWDLDVERVLSTGLLPQVQAEPGFAVDILDAYVANYIREEIQQEAAVRSLDSFVRFLEIAGLMNAQLINLAGIARDAEVARPTVQGYFSTLVDTLIGFRLPAWRRRAKLKEVASPKFYVFDPGVARALAGRAREPLEREERGFLLDTWIVHEVRAAMASLGTGGQLWYWRTPSGSEVDLVWTRGATAVGLEIKASTVWRAGFGSVIGSLIDSGILTSGYGVYLGAHELRDGRVRVMPVLGFLKALSAGSVLSARA
jgi:predicted AAA+ superfamily ATPase